MAAATELKITTPSDVDIQMIREFDAPREIVFDVLTDCSTYPRWWGPRKYKAVIEQCEMRPGGKWRFRHIGDDGEHVFYGEFVELTRPERFVWTFEYEPWAGHGSLETMVLEDLGNGRTRLTATSRWAKKEDRDGMLQSGMESGARETYERLDELLDELKAKKA